MTAALWFAAGFCASITVSALASLLLVRAAARAGFTAVGPDPEPERFDPAALDTADDLVAVDPADPTPIHTALCVAELRREMAWMDDEGAPPWS